MNQKIVMNDISDYRIFSVAGKFGIQTWCQRLIFPPKCLTKPNLKALEDDGYTFVHLDDGWNLINRDGTILMKECVDEALWIRKNEIVAFSKAGEEGMFFVKEKKYIRDIDDISLEVDFIKTFRKETARKSLEGIATYWGIEVFPPKYSAVAVFANDIYVAFKDDGTAVLNSPNWERTIDNVDATSLIKSKKGGEIMAKLQDKGYQWIDHKTGEIIPSEEQNLHQKSMIAAAKEQERVQNELK